jgi:drug/metabolite transporter (DMT)-like permease
MTEKSKGHIAILATNLIFGLNNPLTKSLLSEDHIDAYALTYFRFIGSCAVFWLASLIFTTPKASRKDVLLLCLASIFGVICNQMLFVVGLNSTTPVNASIIVSLTPVLTMIFASIFIKEPITFKKFIGVCFGLGGALLLILTSSSSSIKTNNASAIGIIFCFISGISYALYLTMFQKLIKRNHPITIMKWMFLIGTIAVLPITYPHVKAVPYDTLSTMTYLKILYVVLVATFLTYLLIPIGQNRLRPTTLSMYNYIQPIVTTTVAIIIGMDVFTIYKLIACLSVFLGVYIVNKSKSKAQIIDQHKAKETLKQIIKK